jgi:hypothetical protein
MHVVVWNKHPRAKELISRFNRGLKTIKGSGDFKKMIIETRSKINQSINQSIKERRGSTRLFTLCFL